MRCPSRMHSRSSRHRTSRGPRAPALRTLLATSRTTRLKAEETNQRIGAKAMKTIGRGAKRISWLVLGVSLLAGGWTSPGRAQKSGQSKDSKPENHVPDPPGKVAFATDRDGNFEIYVMNADGGGLL